MESTSLGVVTKQRVEKAIFISTIKMIWVRKIACAEYS